MVVFTIVLSLVCFHVVFVLLAIFGWLRKSKFENVIHKESIGLIIPFRNEAENLPRLLGEIKNIELIKEVILVNDHSEDDSENIIEKFIHQNKQFSIHLIQSNGEGKKQATATGVRAAKSDYLLFSDVDTSLHTNFARNYMILFSKGNVDFAYGPVVYDSKKIGLIPSIFFLDQLSLNGLSLGTGKMGLHLFCSGANMGGEKSFVMEALPVLEQSNNLSGDDTDILSFANQSGKKIEAITAKTCLVTTSGPTSFANFFKQRLRWGQKAIHFNNLPALLLATVELMLPIAFFYTLAACISGVWLWNYALVLMPKFLIDLLFLFLVSYQLGVIKHMLFFIPSWIFNQLYIPIIGLLGLFYSGTWKGRKIKR